MACQCLECQLEREDTGDPFINNLTEENFPTKRGYKMKAYMIIDLQFGSTGKGLLAGYLAMTEKPDVVVTAWAPNAGHTYIAENGRKYIHRMLANGVVSPNLKFVLLGAGSVIDFDILYSEICSCADHLRGKTIIIHPNAAVVSSEHVTIEKRNVKIGSTMKGTGAAMIQRIERDPDSMNTVEAAIPHDFIAKCGDLGVLVEVSKKGYFWALAGASCVQIEGAQGYSLSIYHGFYPYTTSRDVTSAQVMADCCIPWDFKPKIFGTIRTFPIRVAHRFDEAGNQIGNSGPCYDDQRELDWSELGMEPELTTVTKLPRRIFTFSMDQLREATCQCGVDKVFLNFANYMKTDELFSLMEDIETCTDIGWIGHGPNHRDVMPLLKVGDMVAAGTVGLVKHEIQ